MKKFIAAVLVSIFVLPLVGCATPEAADTPATEAQEQTPEDKMTNSYFVNLVEKGFSDSIKLVYDSETHIVYYYQNYNYTKTAAAALCPYYSANGYLCRYNTETKKIEEIIH